MRLLITRSPEDAAPLVSAFAAHGHESLVAPLFTVELQDHSAEEMTLALDGVQAVLFTSANGVRAFAAQSAVRDRPVYAVGDATAAAARGAGFTQVESAGGNVEDLAELVGRRLDPAKGPLFHAAAREVAGDLQGRLAGQGFELRRLVLYRARPVEQLASEAREALATDRIDAILFFSPRSGGSFVRLVRAAGLAQACQRLHAVCLSRAVAAEVEQLDWASVRIAERPDAEALLAATLALQPGACEPEGVKPEPARRTMVDDKEKDKAAEQAGVSSAAADADPRGPSETTPSAKPAIGAEGESKPASETEGEAAALAVIAAFGGIRPMASRLGIAVSTVQGWRERAAIPQARHDQILAAAKANDVKLDEALLRASDKTPTLPGKPKEAAKVTPPPARSALPSSTGPAKPAGESARPAAAATQRPSAPAAREPQRSGAGLIGFVLGAVVFAAGAAAAVFTAPQWQPLLGQSGGAIDATDALQQQLSSLTAQLKELDGKVTKLAETPASGGSDTAELSKLSSTVEALGKRLDSLESAGGQAASSEALDKLSAENAQTATRLAQIESQIAALEDTGKQLQGDLQKAQEASQQARAAAGGGSAMALAIGQLRDALRGSAPYSDELTQLESLTADDPQLAGLIAPLKPYAANGAPSEEALRRSFPAVARAAVAAGQGDDDQGWLGSVLRSVSQIVSIRPVGDVEGDNPGAVVARAETALDAGNLNGAVAELDKLQGPAAAAASSWRGRAEARLAADQALSALSAHAIARLGPSDG